jgi:hypothetical protein
VKDDRVEKSLSNGVKDDKNEKSSSDWVEYYKDDNGNVLFYNKKLNIDKEGIVQVWGKRFYSEKGRRSYIQNRMKEGMPTEGYDKLSNTQDLYKIDCKKQMMNLLSVVRYDTNGKVMYSKDIEKPEWDHIIPDTVMDTLQKKVCE